MGFSQDEVERYARHLVLREVGGPGQQKLKAAKVLMVGAGGLGAPAALYLAAAGVGTIGLVDPDAVSLSNLQRQVLYAGSDVGRPKVEAAKEHLTALNQHVSIEPHPVWLNAENAGDIVSRYDLVLDGTDDFATRFAVSDACLAHGKPLVSGAAIGFDAQVSVFDTRDAAAPCYACVFPPESSPEAVNCATMDGAGGGVSRPALLPLPGARGSAGRRDLRPRGRGRGPGRGDRLDDGARGHQADHRRRRAAVGQAFDL